MEYSFSGKVKNEIYFGLIKDRHCRIAMLSAIINCCCEAELAGGNYSLRVKSENPAVKDKLEELAAADFAGGFAGNTEKLLQAAGVLDIHTNAVCNNPNHLVVKSPCCKRSYIAGAFLCIGSINDPRKTYHLEFATGQHYNSDGLIALLRFFGLNPKTVERKGHKIIYFKEAEQIAVILNIVGAHVSLMEFENRRVYKNVGNSINRIANCESANADKSVTAAVKQIEDIELIERTIGLSALPPPLEEAARLRLEFPEMSLEQIAREINPPISKSGVNHRFRKISLIVKNIRNY